MDRWDPSINGSSTSSERLQALFLNVLSGHGVSAKTNIAHAKRSARRWPTPTRAGVRRGSESAGQGLPEEEAFDINERAGARVRSAADSLHQ